MRKPRKKRRVMGWELNRQLRSPARGCGRSICWSCRWKRTMLLVLALRVSPVNVVSIFSYIGRCGCVPRVRCAFRLRQRLLQRPPSNSSSSFLCLCIFLLRCCEEYQPLLISVSVIRLILCWSCNCCCGYCRITTSDVDKQSQPPIIQAIHPTHAFS